MDSTCTPSTLIIVDVWLGPRAVFGGRRGDAGASDSSLHFVFTRSLTRKKYRHQRD